MTFKSATDATALERISKKAGVKGRIVPVPRSISASCGLCYICDSELKEELMRVISENKLEYEELYYREMF